MSEPKRSEFMILWFVSAAILAVYYGYLIFQEIVGLTRLPPELRDAAFNVAPFFLPVLIILTLGYLVGMVLVWRWNTWGLGVIIFVSIGMLLFDLVNRTPIFGVFGTPWTQPFLNIVMFIIGIRSHWDDLK